MKDILIYFSVLFTSPYFSVLLFPAPCWLARLHTWATPEIQRSWRTQPAAYASQVMCTQTCNLQIINAVLISHINSCHFVGIVSPRWSPGLLPANVSQRDGGSDFLRSESESGASEQKNKKKKGRWQAHKWHKHVHRTHRKYLRTHAREDSSRNSYTHFKQKSACVCVHVGDKRRHYSTCSSLSTNPIKWPKQSVFSTSLPVCAPSRPAPTEDVNL